jgi:hypothetical protein
MEPRPAAFSCVGQSMANNDESIPQKLREAFDQAVSVYPSWTPLLPERLVTIDDRFLTMSEVCVSVEKFHDPLPMPVFDRLSTYIAEHRVLRDKLEQDQTYSTAASCFRQLIERRKRHPQLFGEQ